VIFLSPPGVGLGGGFPTIAPVAGESPTVPLTTGGRLNYLGELWRRRHFAWYLAMGNIRARHSSTTLGLLWWMVDPLLLGGLFLLVFGVILKTSRGDPNYIGFLLSGLFAFNFTRDAMTSGAGAITTNSQLIATQYFPRMLLPLSAIIEGGVELLFSMIPFFLIVGTTHGDWPRARIVVLVPAFLLHTMFNLGLSLILAQLVIPFRDIGNIAGYAARFWMYLSPVIYPIDDRLANAPHAVVTILSINPLAAILGLYRGALLGREIRPYYWWSSAAWAVGILVLGVVTFRRVEGKLARYLV
jgi:teichoic acid transport system permease protein